jgi:diguanylate cyclase (GGDEF)-like protein
MTATRLIRSTDDPCSSPAPTTTTGSAPMAPRQHGSHRRSFAFRLRAALLGVLLPCVAVGAFAWVSLEQARDDAEEIARETAVEHALIGELQAEVRHADVEFGLMVDGNKPGARQELIDIIAALDIAFDRTTEFDRGEEREVVLHARHDWQAARTVAAPWLTEPPGQPDRAAFGRFHEHVDVATARLDYLASISREELAIDVATYSTTVQRNQQILVASLAIAMLATLWLARRLRLATYRPLRELVSSLDAISAYGLRERVEITGDREFHTVAEALNEMSERLHDTVEELDRQAFHDSLTGLPNRASLERRLGEALAGSDLGRVGVMMLDLDGFKAINDGLGHPAGDQVLIAVGERLRCSLRRDDLIGRLGGDEFAVVVPDTSPLDMAAIASRIDVAFQQPIDVAGRALLVAISAGAALDRQGDTPADLFRNADIALYSAKASGKARLHMFEPLMLDRAEARLATETELRAAVQTGQIVVHYQPTVSIRTGGVVGVEALARWDHPTRGLLAPGLFIALAEETGLIVPLGQVVLDSACAQVALWHRNVPELAQLDLSVNVSARQLRSTDIVDKVRGSLVKSGLSPAHLILEVTESITADSNAVATLHQLRELGVRIALDDFGTGYSSLSYLQHLPIDVLKLDKGFVDAIHTHADRAALAGAIVRLGRSFGLETVGEGVEHPEQLVVLAQLGCDLAQGYLIARPAAADTIYETLRSLARTHSAPPAARSTSPAKIVTVRIGPVPAVSAIAWLADATEILDRFRDLPPEGVLIPRGVLAAIDTYLAVWSKTALSCETFLWSGDEDPNVLRAIVQHWFRIVEEMTTRAGAPDRTRVATSSRPFDDALVSGILVALAIGGDKELEAEALAWQRSWPRTPFGLAELVHAK